MQQVPWELNSDLSEDRLIEMANFIANVRDEVIELHDDDLGDTSLSLGMRAYECCRSRIISASKASLFSWLSILTPENRFTFAIGKTPVRFTRNDPKYLPDRKLVISENAMEQMALFDDQQYAGIRWFFVFDTHYRSAADAVYFVGYNELGHIVCQWQIPISDGVTLISDASDSIPQAVELSKPTVSVKRSSAKIDSTKNGK